jgi:putative peptidoglycan binding protein
LSLPANKIFAVSAILALLAGHAYAQTTVKKPPSSATQTHSSKSKSVKGKSRRPKKGAWKHHGQQGIQSDRARAIQEALIRENYLTGEPTSQWDARTKDAMTRYQADHGWQTKVTPDSRALIKLGLGPNYSDSVLKTDAKPPSDAVTASGAGGAATSKQR